MALGDAVVEAVQAVLANEGRDLRLERPEDLDRPAVAGSAPTSSSSQGLVVQAAGVDDEDVDRRAGAGDRVEQHHVFGAQARGERRAVMAGADSVQAAEQLAFDEHGRVGKRFHGDEL